MRQIPANIVALVVLLLTLFGLSSGILLANRQDSIVAQTAQATTIEETAIGLPTVVASPINPTSTIPWYADLPPTERAMEEFKEALRQNDIQTVTAMAILGITPPPLPTLELSGPGAFPISDGRRPAGAGDIIDDSLNLLFRKGFKVSNVWTAPLEGVQVIVYAGNDRDTPQQGGVFVQWGEPGNFHPSRANQYYPTPKGIASVRIIDAVGTTLLLSTFDGIKVKFDVLSGIYYSENNTSVPTLTPTRDSYPVPISPIPATVAPLSN